MMALMQVPARITAAFLTISHNKYVILMMINVLLLVMGCLLDMAPAILICTPILLPVMVNFGVDPVHFGMIMMMNSKPVPAPRRSARFYSSAARWERSADRGGDARDMAVLSRDDASC